MTSFGTIQSLLLAGLAFVAIAGILASAAVPLTLRWTETWSPENRHRVLVLLGVAPLALALLTLFSVVLPSLLALSWPAYDHCLGHHGHAHLCFVHGSTYVGGWAGWAVIAVALVWVAMRLTQGAISLVRASRLIEELARSARLDTERKAWVAPASEAFCLVAGVLRPRIVVSEGLLERASNDEVEVMLAHEGAHVQRSDTLVRLLVSWASLPMLPHARHLLLSALELSSEQACDEQAARQVDDRLRVAETILSLERCLAASHWHAQSPMVASFGSSTVAPRVEALLLPPRVTGGCRALLVCLCLVVASLLGLSEHLHHVTESVLAVLLY